MGTVRSSKVRKLSAVLGNSIKLVCPSMKKLQILRNVDDGTFAQLTGIRLKYLRNTHACVQICHTIEPVLQGHFILCDKKTDTL